MSHPSILSTYRFNSKYVDQPLNIDHFYQLLNCENISYDLYTHFRLDTKNNIGLQLNELKSLFPHAIMKGKTSPLTQNQLKDYFAQYHTLNTIIERDINVNGTIFHTSFKSCQNTISFSKFAEYIGNEFLLTPDNINQYLQQVYSIFDLRLTLPIFNSTTIQVDNYQIEITILDNLQVIASFTQIDKNKDVLLSFYIDLLDAEEQQSIVLEGTLNEFTSFYEGTSLSFEKIVNGEDVSIKTSDVRAIDLLSNQFNYFIIQRMNIINEYQIKSPYTFDIAFGKQKHATSLWIHANDENKLEIISILSNMLQLETSYIGNGSDWRYLEGLIS